MARNVAIYPVILRAVKFKLEVFVETYIHMYISLYIFKIHTHAYRYYIFVRENWEMFALSLPQ